MSRWRREKHRRETARLRSFRDRLANKTAEMFDEMFIEGTGGENGERDK